jgi:hypothetical protein
MSNIIIVDTNESLKTAIDTASAGDIIQIAAGEYGSFNIRNKQQLSLVAKDSHNKPNLERINIFESDTITMDQLNFGNSQKSTIAVNASYSKNITLSNTEIKNYHDAVGIRHSENIQIINNQISNITRDGLSILDVSHIVIQDNFFTQFHPNYEDVLYKDWYFDAEGTTYLPDKVTPTDHADFIQLTDSRDISIISNVLDATGGAWTQSILISGGHYNEPALIMDNIIKNGHTIGIRVYNQENIVQINNTLLQIETLGVEGLQAQHYPDINIESYNHNDVQTVIDGKRLLINTNDTDVVIPPSQASEVTTRPNEGDTNHLNYFLLSIDTAYKVDFSIYYETRDGSAIAGQDYIATSGIATLRAGEKNIAIAVEIIADQVSESNENFYLVATQFETENLSRSLIELIAIHTIIDND